MKYTPTWKDHEAKITSPDPVIASKAAEVFDDERTKETQVSKKAREWEADRKKNWNKDKHTYIKSKRNEDAKATVINTKKIIDGGSIAYDIKPARGYLLIKLTEIEQSGDILLPETQDMQNIAEILAVGGDLILEKNILLTPVKVGDVVLLKKGAGMDLMIKNSANKLCLFTDVLGVLEV